MTWSWGYLFNQINTSLQIHAKIDEGPLDAFALVLFLLEHKHVVVEELLQLFVCEVDAQLFESIVLWMIVLALSGDYYGLWTGNIVLTCSYHW